MIVGWYFYKNSREVHLYQGANGGEFECWSNDPDCNLIHLENVYNRHHDIYEVAEFLEKQGYIMR